MDMSSYDISNIRSLDTMDLLSSSSPTGKAPSIFSPEWSDKSNSMTSMPVTNHDRKLQSNDNGSNGSEGALLDKLSPKKQYDKRAMSSTDTMKKEKRMDSHHQQAQRLSMPMDKRSVSVKREAPSFSGGMQYDASLPQNLLDSKPMKRTFNAEPLQQLDSLELEREFKIRKMSPSSSNVNDPTKPLDDDTNLAAHSTLPLNVRSSLNGIETNPDLVSSLLKESLSDTTSKYGGAPQAAAGAPINNAGNQGKLEHFLFVFFSVAYSPFSSDQ